MFTGSTDEQYEAFLNKKSLSPPDDGSLGKMEITGLEASLLLRLLDKHIQKVSSTTNGQHEDLDYLNQLRDRLFAAREHPKEDEEDNI